jgi:hypothetical protein
LQNPILDVGRRCEREMHAGTACQQQDPKKQEGTMLQNRQILPSRCKAPASWFRRPLLFYSELVPVAGNHCRHRRKQAQSSMERCSTRRMKIRIGSAVPPGLGFMLGGFPGFPLPLRSTQGQGSPWAILLRSLRELAAVAELCAVTSGSIFRAVGHGTVKKILAA